MRWVFDFEVEDAVDWESVAAWTESLVRQSAKASTNTSIMMHLLISPDALGVQPEKPPRADDRSEGPAGEFPGGLTFRDDSPL